MKTKNIVKLFIIVLPLTVVLFAGIHSEINKINPKKGTDTQATKQNDSAKKLNITTSNSKTLCTRGYPCFINKRNTKISPRFYEDNFIYKKVAEDVDGSIYFVRTDKYYKSNNIIGVLVWNYDPVKNHIYLFNRRYDCHAKGIYMESGRAVDVDDFKNTTNIDIEYTDPKDNKPPKDSMGEKVMLFACNL